VDSVNIYQDSVLLEEKLTPDLMVIVNDYESEYEQEITLYYPDKGYTALYAEKRQLTVMSSKSLSEYVIDELLKGTKNTDRSQALPEGSRLLSVKTEAGLCKVDFSREFYTNRPLKADAERLMLYSVINTLTELEDITHVQFTVEGERLSSYTYIDISKPFARAEEFIKTGKDYWEESTVNVYLGTADGKLAAVKVAAGSLNYEEWASSVINYYISLDSFWGYKRVIPEGTKINSIEVDNKLCRLDLSNEFLNGSIEERRIAAKAIAATLYDALIAEQVVFYSNGLRLFDKDIFTKDTNIIAD
jgi:spore germination protein GerM